MKTLHLLISLLLAMPVIAQTPTKFQTDVLQFGRGTSLLPKELIFDAGDGASNKKFSLDPSDNELDLNTTLNITGNLEVTADVLAPAGQVNSSTLNVETTSTLKGNVTLGDGTDADRLLQVNRTTFDPFLKWDESLGKWVFSNDGTIEKPFGSGSGSGDGGINLLENPSFEDGVSVDWTSTCSSFTGIDYTNPKPNDTVFARCVASAPGEYFESNLKVIPDFFTGGCLAYGYYNTSTNNAWSFQVYSEGVLVSEKTLPTTDGKWLRTPYIAIQCPAAGDDIKMRVLNLIADTVDWDNSYLGNENRLVNIQQSRLAGDSYFNATSGCTWQRTSATPGPFGTVAACPGPTVVNSQIGQWQTTDSDLPRQTIQNLPAGTYKATFTGQSSMTVVATPVLTVSDGTTTCQPVVAESSASNGSMFTISCVFNYTQPGTRSFELYGAASANTISVNNGLTTPVNGTKFVLEYYPNDSQTGVTSDESDWMIDANIGGAQVNLNTSADVTTYTELTSSALDLVLNDGSATAKIPCSATNASTGLTCSAGDEGLGVVFTPPFTGYFDVCAYFTHTSNLDAAETNSAAFQLMETTPSTQTVIQEGKTRTNSFFLGGTGGMSWSQQHTNCGTFKFTSTTEKTIRLMYEQDITGTQTNQIFADRSASVGQRDVRITVKPSTKNTARPVLTGDESLAPSTGGMDTCFVQFGGASETTNCTSSPCVEYWDSCGAVSSAITRSGTGDYLLSFDAGTWQNSTNFSCKCTAPGGNFQCNNASGAVKTDANGGLAMVIRTATSAGVANDRYPIVECTGYRR